MISRTEPSIFTSITKVSSDQSNKRSWVLFRFPIHNHWKVSVSEKKQIAAKYFNWNSRRFKFVKKTSLSNLAISFQYRKCYSSISRRPIESPSNCIRYNCLKICSRSIRHEIILKMKKTAFRYVINKPIICKFLQTFLTTERRLSEM